MGLKYLITAMEIDFWFISFHTAHKTHSNYTNTDAQGIILTFIGLIETNALFWKL